LLSKLYEVYKKYSFKNMLKKAKPYISVDKSAILLSSVNISFRTPRKNIGVIIGKDSIVGCNCIFESSGGKISIGEHTYIGGGNMLISRNEIYIGNDVLISWGCWIYDHNSHSLNWEDRYKDIDALLQSYKNNKRSNIYLNKNWETVKSAPIKICDKAWIGFNSIILKGVTIGEGAVIGAGTIVTKDVPAWSVVAGNPAKVVKEIEH
jgi:galactoside O-acetyltransferase